MFLCIFLFNARSNILNYYKRISYTGQLHIRGTKMEKYIYVLYHRNCSDGLGSKFAAYKKFGDQAHYIPVQYNEQVPEELNYRLNSPEAKDLEVYILDFSFPRKILDDIHTRVKKLLVIDHHKTARDELTNCEYAIFDMNKSGALMSWEYFHPDIPVPMIILHVSDRDLWKFEIHGTEAISTALIMEREDMAAWELYLDEDNLKDLKLRGLELIKFRDYIINSYPNKSKIINYKGNRVAICNATEFISEIGHKLCNSYKLQIDFSITFIVLRNTDVVLSFRSKFGGPDVSVYAKELGGGGHANSAGAKVSIEKFKEIIGTD